MSDIQIMEATAEDAVTVANLVQSLLTELEPEAAEEIVGMPLAQTAQALLATSDIRAFLAWREGQPIGVITLHQCAALYAGGLFGEISELYVIPQARSADVGQLLLNAAADKGRALNWKRLEVGAPPPDKSPRTLRFYEQQGFECTGARLRRLI